MASVILERNCYVVKQNLWFRHVGKKWEIDVVGYKKPIVLCVDRKHWRYGKEPMLWPNLCQLWLENLNLLLGIMLKLFQQFCRLFLEGSSFMMKCENSEKFWSFSHTLFLTTTALVSKLFEKVPISCKPRVSGSIIFMRKSAFNSIGGYWENPVAEDQHIAKRLASVGKFVVITRNVVTTSARRWIKWGFFRAIAIMMVNSWMAVMFDKTWLKTGEK